jgi:hypothetical protein
MSYAPIYNKLHDLEERVALMERAPKTNDASLGIMIGTPADAQSTDLSGVIAELNNVKADLNRLLSVDNSTKTDVSAHVIDYLTAIATLATKEEVATLATKAELPDVSEFATKAELPDVSGFATKAELPDVSAFVSKAELPDVSEFATKAELPDVSGFVTKTELTDLYTKFDNVLNVIAQLHIKITEANEKIAALESA